MLDIVLPPVDDLLEGGHAPQVQAVADHAGLQDVYVAVGKPRQDAAAAQVDFFRVRVGQGQGRLPAKAMRPFCTARAETVRPAMVWMTPL